LPAETSLTSASSYVSCEGDTARIYCRVSCCCAAVPLMVYARRSAANPPHVGAAVAFMGQTDGRTQDHVIGSDPLPTCI